MSWKTVGLEFKSFHDSWALHAIHYVEKMGRRGLSAKIMTVQFPVHSPCRQILEAAHGPISGSRPCSSLIHLYWGRGCIWLKQEHGPVWEKWDREMAWEIEWGSSPECLVLGILGMVVADISVKGAPSGGWAENTRLTPQSRLQFWAFFVFPALSQTQAKQELNNCCLTDKSLVYRVTCSKEISCAWFQWETKSGSSPVLASRGKF